MPHLIFIFWQITFILSSSELTVLSIHFLKLRISDSLRDDTTTPLKGCVCRVACASILSGDIFLNDA